jgi:hypothetical protein
MEADMKLMKLNEYIVTHYTKLSKPSKRVIINLINQGIVSGKKLGKFYYVDIDAESKKTGNPLVDRVLGL